MARLEVHELTVAFGAVEAVRGVSFEVGAGQLVGLIGPNGAGKTATLDAISGFAPHGGHVLLDGHDLGRSGPHERARRGLVRTWQARELFDGLTVAQGCAVAATHPAAVSEALELTGLTSLGAALPEELDQGQRAAAGVARAVAARPRALLLDEPAAGLDAAGAGALATLLRRLAAGGVAVVLVDHDVDLVLELCQHVVVLDLGRVIAAGAPEEVRADPRVVAAYLGVEG